MKVASRSTRGPGVGIERVGIAMTALGLACIPTAPRSALSGPTIQPEVRLGDCATAEQGLEFAPFMISDFEQGLGQYAYTYVDNTAAISPSGYQQPTEPGQHCVDDPGHNVFHAHGGPFLGWGGGFGVAMQHIVAANCVGSPLPDYCIPPGAQPEVTGLYLDASQWDGVAVWARRGAGGQPLLRVLIGNKYTDDDISFTMYNYYPNEPRYCERVRECACINGLQCTFSQDQDHGGPVGVVPGGGYYCGAPGIVSGPDVMARRRHAARYQHLRHHPLRRPLPGVSEDRRRQHSPVRLRPGVCQSAVPAVHLSLRASPPASVTATTIRCPRRPTSSAATTGRTR